MMYNTPSHKHCIDNELLSLKFNANHTLHAIYAGDVMVSQFETPETEKGISNIYLRQKQNDGYAVTPLLFFNDSIETFLLDDGNIAWKTTTSQWTATVISSLSKANAAFFYQVEVENHTGHALDFDLVYGQDLALADRGSVQTNEAYCSQYLDHEVFKTDESGYVVCSRQNLPQSTGNPMIQIGCFDDIVAYSTDGYQFFGTAFKVDETLSKLQTPMLDNEKYQYEMGFIALQTEAYSLSPVSTKSTVFYGLYQEHCADSNVKQPRDISVLKDTFEASNIGNATAVNIENKDLFDTGIIVGDVLSEAELTHFFSQPNERRFVEEKDGKVLSFFHGDNHYVTLQEKEKYLERTTGHVIASGNNQDCNQPVMSSTHHMFGIFNSQLTLGNTSFNKLLGVNRNSLNQFKHSGQRIWVKEQGKYNVLAMPSAFEVGLNFSRWVYKYQQGFIIVSSFSSAVCPAIQTEILTQGLEDSLDIAVSHQLVFGNNENTSNVRVTREENTLLVSGQGVRMNG